MKKSNLVTTILLALGMVLTLVFVTSTLLIADDDPKGPLRSISDYVYVGQLGKFDEQGRQLIWKGTLNGDIDGVELWWFGPAPPTEVREDYSVHYYVARWEIYDDDPLLNEDAELLVAGDSKGETVVPTGGDGIWDGSGKVTKTCEEFKYLEGRKLYEGGPVIFNGLPHGIGLIRIEGVGNRYGNNKIELDKEATEIAEGKLLPEKFELLQNYPNPFNPETTIRFQIPEATQVTVKIFNNLGQEIRMLTNKPYQAGYHSVHWDGMDNRGNAVSSGIYLYKLKAGTFNQVKKMNLTR